MLIAGSLYQMYDNDIKEFNVIWKNPLYQISDYNMFDKYLIEHQMKVCKLSMDFHPVRLF